MTQAEKAVCYFCQDLKPIHFEVRDVALRSGEGFVPQIRVGVCDVCDKVISIPQEAVPQVKAAIEATKVEPRPIAPARYNTSLSCYDDPDGMGLDYLEKGS